MRVFFLRGNLNLAAPVFYLMEKAQLVNELFHKRRLNYYRKAE